MKMERRSPRAVCLFFRRTERKKESKPFKLVRKKITTIKVPRKKKKRSRPRLGEAAALLLLQAGGIDVYPCLLQSPPLHLERQERAYVEPLDKT